MRFESSLIHGRLVYRYKRVIADVELDSGKVVSAYCPNATDMKETNKSGIEIWLSRVINKNRKLRYIWELAFVNGAVVGVNAGKAVGLAMEAIDNNVIKELIGYKRVLSSVSCNISTYLDLLLQADDSPPCYVGIHHLHEKQKENAVFPTSVIIGNRKKLDELQSVAKEGNRAVLLYIIQRSDCMGVKIAGDTDPLYLLKLKEIMSNGVEVLCYGCNADTKSISLNEPLKLIV